MPRGEAKDPPHLLGCEDGSMLPSLTAEIDRPRVRDDSLGQIKEDAIPLILPKPGPDVLPDRMVEACHQAEMGESVRIRPTAEVDHERLAAFAKGDLRRARVGERVDC